MGAVGVQYPVAIGQDAIYPGSNICILGDSIGAMQSSTNAAGSRVFWARGYVNWMQSFLGFPWEFEPEDNYAISGATFLSTLREQLPKLAGMQATKRYTRCFVSNGTNDTVNGSTYGHFTLAQIKENALALFTAIRNLGMIPVYHGVPARGTDAESLQYKAWAANLNEWFYQLGQTGLIEYVPLVQQVFADPGSAYGNSAAGMTYDNTHPSNAGGALAGYQYAQYYQARGVGPNMRFANVANDVFDRNDNPTGSMFTNPVLAGTSGSGSTIAPSGGASVGGGTGTYATSIGAGTGVWSKVTRALPNGTSRSDPRVTLGGAATHRLQTANILAPASGGWATDGSKLLPGDVIEARAKIVGTGVANLRETLLKLVEGNGATAYQHWGLASQDTTIALPISDFTLYLKTPEITIRPYGGSGQPVVYCHLDLITLASPTGTIDVQAFEVRRLR